MNLLNLLLIFLWFLLFVKAFLKILYIVQLKEYRWDRLKAFLKTYSGKRFFLPKRFFLRPKLTIKIALVIISTLLLSLSTGLILYFTFLDDRAFFAGLFFAYLLIPLLVVASLGLLFPLEFLAKKQIILRAKIKINKFKNLKTIGITGSFGKTNTKEILAAILQTKYKICKTKGTNNTILGVAKTILRDLTKDHQFFVAEMGAYKIGEIRQICQLVNPKIGIVTGINQQHLELFGSFENIAKAKHELIEALPKDGLAVLNASNKYTLAMAKKTMCKVLFFGRDKKIYETSLVGDHFQKNIQAALAVSDYLKIRRHIALGQIKAIRPLAQTLKIKKSPKEAVIIDDSYSSNPEGFLSALKLMASFNKKRKVVITSGIIELGSASDIVHQNLGVEIAKAANWLILTNKNFYKAILKGLKKSNKNLKIDILSKVVLGELKRIKNKSDTIILSEGRMPESVKKALLF